MLFGLCCCCCWVVIVLAIIIFIHIHIPSIANKLTLYKTFWLILRCMCNVIDRSFARQSHSKASTLLGRVYCNVAEHSVTTLNELEGLTNCFSCQRTLTSPSRYFVFLRTSLPYTFYLSLTVQLCVWDCELLMCAMICCWGISQAQKELVIPCVTNFFYPKVDS